MTITNILEKLRSTMSIILVKMMVCCGCDRFVLQAGLWHIGYTNPRRSYTPVAYIIYSGVAIGGLGIRDPPSGIIFLQDGIMIDKIHKSHQ